MLMTVGHEHFWFLMPCQILFKTVVLNFFKCLFQFAFHLIQCKLVIRAAITLFGQLYLQKLGIHAENALFGGFIGKGKFYGCRVVVTCGGSSLVKLQIACQVQEFIVQTKTQFFRLCGKGLQNLACFGTHFTFHGNDFVGEVLTVANSSFSRRRVSLLFSSS